MAAKRTVRGFIKFLLGVRLVDEKTAEALKGRWRWEILGPARGEKGKRKEREGGGSGK